MTHVIRHISFFVMMIVCLNSVIIVASDPSFCPPVFGANNGLKVYTPFWTRMAVHMPKGSVMASAFLGKSLKQMNKLSHLVYNQALIHSRELSVVMTAAVILSLVWSQRQSIKDQWNDLGLVKKGKEKATSWGEFANTKIDNGIGACPFPLNSLFAAIKSVLVWFGRNTIAIEGEYLTGAFFSPLIGYVNSLTPFGGLFGPYRGFLLAGVFFTRGWLRIDHVELKDEVQKTQKMITIVGNELKTVHEGVKKNNKNIKEVGEQVNNLDKKVEKGNEDIKALINDQIKVLNEQIDQLGANMDEAHKILILQNQETSNNVQNLGIKMEDEIKKSHELFEKEIEKVCNKLKEIVKQVKDLPDENKKVVDEAMAIIVKKLETVIDNQVKTLDEKTTKELTKIQNELTDIKEQAKTLTKIEDELTNIKEQSQTDFNTIKTKQNQQSQQIDKLAVDLTRVLDQRENDIKHLTNLVDTTNLSNKELLNKFESLKDSFTDTQKAFKESDEKYSELLAKEMEDWKKFEGMISDQINDFNNTVQAVNAGLLELQQQVKNTNTKVEHMETKVEDITTNVKNINTKINTNQEELLKQNELLLNKIKLQEQQQAEIIILMKKNNEIGEKLKQELDKTKEDAIKERKSVFSHIENVAKKLENTAKGFEKNFSTIINMLSQNETPRITSKEEDQQQIIQEHKKIKKQKAYKIPGLFVMEGRENDK